MMREDIENSRTIRNEDRRIRKTKHAIQNSLYMLLYEKRPPGDPGERTGGVRGYHPWNILPLLS